MDERAKKYGTTPPSHICKHIGEVNYTRHWGKLQRKRIRGLRKKNASNELNNHSFLYGKCFLKKL